jgi:hypothetical protein
MLSIVLIAVFSNVTTIRVSKMLVSMVAMMMSLS